MRTLFLSVALVVFGAAVAAIQPPSADKKPRVFFVELQDGATVKSPVRLKFGIQNYELAAVPTGTVETARPSMGHHHVGVGQDCLPPGTVIVKGTPNWIHFGDGKTEIEMQLPPGRHKLTLQLGDDLHTTVAGLCQTIWINVTQ